MGGLVKRIAVVGNDFGRVEECGPVLGRFEAVVRARRHHRTSHRPASSSGRVCSSVYKIGTQEERHPVVEKK